jgi:hypothetical protein
MNFKKLMYKGELGYRVYLLLYKVGRWFRYDRISDERFVKERFKMSQGYDLDLKNPKTLNEKICWLKLYYTHPDEHILADKFAVRDYIKKELGEEYLIPLVFHTSNYRDLIPENFPDYPVIVKANHDSGSYLIIKDKSKVDWKKLQVDARFWMSRNYYYSDREKQYKPIKPCIVVEKLLLTEKGKIPNDYKFNCFHGEVGFIYVSIDREGSNKRNIYDQNWNPLHFTWAAKYKDVNKLRGEEIEPPSSLPEMIRLAKKLSKDFPYVRIDFYDVDGKVYFGEITQHHGGGGDQIRPFEWDEKFGNMINLPKQNYFY